MIKDIGRGDDVLHGGSLYFDGYGNIVKFPDGLTRAETWFIARNVSAMLMGHETDPVFDALVTYIESRGISLFV